MRISVRKAIGAMSVGATCLMLGACTLVLAPTLDLDEAKSTVWQIEDELLARVPREAVVTRWPRTETSSLTAACDSGGASWHGVAWLDVTPELDRQAFIHEVAEEWNQRDGWQARAFDDPLFALLRSPGGYELSIFFADETFTVATWTPCINIPDYSPYEEY